MEDVGKEMKRTMESHNLKQQYQEILKSVYADKDVKEFLKINQNRLDKNAVEKSASKLYEFVNEKKKLSNGNVNFAKGYQPTLILNDHLIDVSYQPTKEHLNLERQKKLAKNFKTVGMTAGIKNVNLDDYDQTADRAVALEASIDFIQSYENNPKSFHKALYLHGPFGVGKTYLLAAVAHRLSDDGFQTLLLHFPSFAVDIKNAINNNQVADKLDSVKKVPVLIIDDIGADSMSTWIRDDILGVILEYRMQHELPTFFSSNFSMEQLEQEHLSTTSRGDIEPLKAKRLMERIKFLAHPIQVSGRNRRNN